MTNGIPFYLVDVFGEQPGSGRRRRKMLCMSGFAAAVEVAEHDPEVAALDRVAVGGRELQIGRVVDSERPRGPMVGEEIRRPLGDRRILSALQ
jgi:hypothetical protein